MSPGGVLAEVWATKDCSGRVSRPLKLTMESLNQLQGRSLAESAEARAEGPVPLAAPMPRAGPAGSRAPSTMSDE